ncbi:CD9 antigen-like [Clavelina lepadiformis]|uniref:CD9 antigen-like n=1 Tax=Clavelina lepadiformis TaxID=159417 RepID=UPI0040428489
MCFSIAKYLLFAFNFCFWLAGAGVLGVGIWLQVESDTVATVEIDGVDLTVGPIVLIVAGSCMLVIGFFGCCGAIKESTCLLGTYFGLLFVVLGLEVGIGVWAFVTYDSLQEAIDTSLNNTLKADNPDFITSFQKNLKCCGATQGCQDWAGAEGSMGCYCEPDDSNDETSCIKTPLECVGTDTPENVYATPCSEAYYDFIYENLTIIGAVGLAVGLAEILGMIIAMCMCCSIKDKKKGVGV